MYVQTTMNFVKMDKQSYSRQWRGEENNARYKQKLSYYKNACVSYVRLWLRDRVRHQIHAPWLCPSTKRPRSLSAFPVGQIVTITFFLRLTRLHIRRPWLPSFPSFPLLAPSLLTAELLSYPRVLPPSCTIP